MDKHYATPPGKVTIAQGVLATIVRMTTRSQPGVLGLSSRAPAAWDRVLSRGTAAEGMRIEVFEDNFVSVDVHIVVDPTVSLKELGEELQMRVAHALEQMTGMHVRAVNVFVDMVEFGGSSPK
jgi:uncharacterized alkaline shock family protein YloU